MTRPGCVGRSTRGELRCNTHAHGCGHVPARCRERGIAMALTSFLDGGNARLYPMTSMRATCRSQAVDAGLGGASFELRDACGRGCAKNARGRQAQTQLAADRAQTSSRRARTRLGERSSARSAQVQGQGTAGGKGRMSRRRAAATRDSIPCPDAHPAYRRACISTPNLDPLGLEPRQERLGLDPRSYGSRSGPRSQ